MAYPQLTGWVPNEYLLLAVPLTEKYVDTKNRFIIHYYEGFDPSLAITICNEFVDNIDLINPINIYLYIIDYSHNYASLDREGCNNGYLQKVGSYYSIVIFRKLFWPKVLIHEILHILWMYNALPINKSTPKWDEAIIESQAVRLSISRGYINEREYRYFLRKSQDEVRNEIAKLSQNKKISGGRFAYTADIADGSESFESLCLSNQKTHVYEYIFLSEKISKLLNYKYEPSQRSL